MAFSCYARLVVAAQRVNIFNKFLQTQYVRLSIEFFENLCILTHSRKKEKYDYASLLHRTTKQEAK